MTTGEVFIAIFVLAFFIFFIYMGIRFFKYNKREREEIALRNEIRKLK